MFLSEAAVPFFFFFFAPTLHSSPPAAISIPDANAETHSEGADIHAPFLSLSAPHLPRTRCLIRDYIYGEGQGQANGEICPHVLNLGEALTLTH